MAELAERLQEAGDASSMTELEGKTFQILSFKMGQRDSTFSEGTYLYADAGLLIEEDNGLVEACVELSGARVCRQIQTLTDGDLPARVKLVRRLDLKGVPWDLLAIAGGAESPKDSKLTEAAKKAGAKEVSRNKDPLKNFRNEDGSVQWELFIGRWQKEKLSLDELGGVIGAVAASALEHYFKTYPDATITTLKEVALAGRTPAESELPFE